jgi:hypothetical protein
VASEPELTQIERLILCDEIMRLKALYCRSVDARDWELFESVFATDAILDFRGAATTAVDNEALHGSAAIVETIRRATDGMTTVHQCHTPEIDIISRTRASAIWHMADILRWPENAPVRAKNGYGYYYETYEKIEGKWKIKTTKLVRTLNEQVPH